MSGSKITRFIRGGAAVGLLCAVAAASPSLAAQKAAPKPKPKPAAAKAAPAPAPAPEAPIPAFAGAEFGWQAAGADYLPPESGPGPVTDDPAHVHVGNGRGQASFRVADTSNPILKPWVVDVLKRTNANVAAGGKGGFTPQVSCIPQGVPTFLLYPAQPVFFVQTPKEILMTWQPDHMTRHVYMNVPHSAKPKPSWFGESVGHYEDGDLVVDTIGVTEKTFVDNFRTPHTSKLHVVERFHIADDQKSMDVEVTVDDFGAFNMPWHARQHYRRVENGPMVESSCAESADNFLHYDIDPIPHADRPDF